MSDGKIVPWLAAQGELSYSPEKPPDRDYFFQYGWVLPEVLKESRRRERHWYFAAHEPQYLLRFWDEARAGRVERVALAYGAASTDDLRAPIAIYSYVDRLSREQFVLVQHGSYQMIDRADQPALDRGVLTLYRGIGKESVFNFVGPQARRSLGPAWKAYAELTAHVLSDSVRSFNSIHDRIKRAETGHLHDGTWMTDALAREFGLDIEGTAAPFWNCVQQSFGLERWVADRKFGPNYVVAETPIDNVRITTEHAGEVEVKLVDPFMLTFTGSAGCSVRCE